MNVKQLLNFYDGNKVAAANAIGYTPQAIDRWKKDLNGSIPFKAQRIVELVTGGKLKAKAG